MKKVLSVYTCGWFVLICSCLLAACSGHPGDEARQVEEYPELYPDYRFVTIPVNIAPLNFSVLGCESFWVDFALDDETLMSGSWNGRTDFSLDKWRKLLAGVRDKSLTVQIWGKSPDGWIRFKPFAIDVAADLIDPFVAYRLIEPGYGMWNHLAVYQRDLSSFEESVVLDNSLVDNGCINCHTFNCYSPSNFMMHVRNENGGTIIADGHRISKIDLRNPITGQSATYPNWHPGGRYIAFSSNDTKQFFYAHADQRIEVYDCTSDLFIYDIQENRVTVDSLFCNRAYLETFPAWSPDGKWLYFCRAAAVDTLHTQVKQLKYKLCRAAFDASSGRLSNQIDTLAVAGEDSKSVSFPRISPDGRYLLYTLSDFATFPIWHKEADLRMFDLETGLPVDLSMANSDYPESYHSWSSNGRWIVFSSRREDGLYTRFYFAYFTPEGQIRKPFILPQRDPGFYKLFMKSYNIPEFVNGKIELTPYEIEEGINGSLITPLK